MGYHRQPWIMTDNGMELWDLMQQQSALDRNENLPSGDLTVCYGIWPIAIHD